MSVIVANKGRYRGDGERAWADTPPAIAITPPSALANHFQMSKAALTLGSTRSTILYPGMK